MQGSEGGEIAVIGAGIVGVATALTLKLEGWPVTLYDPRDPGSGTSFGNAGSISAAGVVPVAVPGLWKRVPGMLLDPMSPLSIRWRHLPRLTPWLVRFLRAGGAENAKRIAGELAPLAHIAVDSHRELLRQTGGMEIVKPVGWLKIYRDGTDYAATAFERELSDMAGIRYEALGADELRQLEPGLSREFTRALFYPDTAFASTPFALTRTYLEAFLARGGRLVREEVRGFEMGPRGPSQLVTDQGRHMCKRVVLAAGAFSGPLARQLGAPVPLDTERGYHLNFQWDGQTPTLQRPTLVSGPQFVLCPMSDGLRLTGGVELGGLEAPPDFRRIRRLAAVARQVLPGLTGEIDREWMGYRPSLPDSKPVIGRSERHPNVWFGFGHGHLGLTYSAATGRLIADGMAGRAESVPLAPFRAERF